ncbi:MAG TPA: hypothetical protein VIE65_03170 [Methylobacter sp.]|jgi:hypothetical protein
MDQVKPSEIASFLIAIADGIDRAKSPKTSFVASDIKAAIAAIDGNEKAVEHIRNTNAAVKAAKEQKPERTASATDSPINLRFQGTLTPDLISKAAAEVAKRRPGFEGKHLKMSISAFVVED